MWGGMLEEGGRWEHQVITMGQESIGKMVPGPHQ